jgi:intracellular sulfur oxidation DsrE/DsrF family protein
MKKLFLVCALMSYCNLASAQTAPYNVVFDITSSDSNAQKTVIRQVKGISGERADAKLEVVVYGGAIDLVLKDKSKHSAAIQELSRNHKASFKVCEGTMKRNNIRPDQLISGVEMVPDGIYEIISKQKEGWGYIKISP